MIEDHPIDTDQEMPTVVSREDALNLLDLLIPADLHWAAQQVWDTVIGPLYDARKAGQDWYRGRCRRCFAHHPALSNPRRFGVPSKPMPHQMHCPKYVGPLEHKFKQALNASYSITGTAMAECTCGQRFPYWADEEKRLKAVCPEILMVWRGPRPEDEESRMTKKKDEAQQEPQTADQGVQDTTGEQSEVERQRLANLKASGQLQEGQDAEQAAQGQQQEGESR